jgi:hypothetical protein
MKTVFRLTYLRVLAASVFCVFLAAAVTVDLSGSTLGLPQSIGRPLSATLFVVVPVLAMALLVVDAAWRWFAAVMLVVYLVVMAPLILQVVG